MDEERSASLQSATRETAQGELQEIVGEFEALGVRLRKVHSSLPVSSREDLMLLGEEDPDYSCIVRGAIECAMNDHLRIVVEILHKALTSEAK